MRRFWSSLVAPPTINYRPHYFVWVDFLRGLAALAVLLWHYQHFYYTSAGASTLIDPSTQPFFRELRFFYTHGGDAVQLFWVISGFVFASIYTTSITSVKAADFIVNRFSRLYPLHIVTLTVVAVLQFITMSKFGHYQIYPYNDLYHFVLNLGFASNWGLERGYSFNAPIWSVSVEVIIYAVFFISIPSVSQRPLLMLSIVAFFILLLKFGIRGGQFWTCGAYFFLGCFVFKIWQALDSRSMKLPLLVGIACVILAMLVHGLIGFLYPGHHRAEITKLAAFPSLVLIAASLDRLDVAALGSKIRFVGDLTYSTYLWHVPVQILTLSLMEGFAFDRVVVSSEWFFVTFLITVFVTAYISFRYLETPSRRAIRDYAFKVESRRQALLS